EAKQAVRKLRARVGDEVERVRIQSGRVGDGHDRRAVDAGFVHTRDTQLWSHGPAQTGHVVYMHVEIDNHGSSGADSIVPAINYQPLPRLPLTHQYFRDLGQP